MPRVASVSGTHSLCERVPDCPEADHPERLASEFKHRGPHRAGGPTRCWTGRGFALAPEMALLPEEDGQVACEGGHHRKDMFGDVRGSGATEGRDRDPSREHCRRHHTLHPRHGELNPPELQCRHEQVCRYRAATNQGVGVGECRRQFPLRRADREGGITRYTVSPTSPWRGRSEVLKTAESNPHRNGNGSVRPVTLSSSEACKLSVGGGGSASSARSTSQKRCSVSCFKHTRSHHQNATTSFIGRDAPLQRHPVPHA